LRKWNAERPLGSASSDVIRLPLSARLGGRRAPLAEARDLRRGARLGARRVHARPRRSRATRPASLAGASAGRARVRRAASRNRNDVARAPPVGRLSSPFSLPMRADGGTHGFRQDLSESGGDAVRAFLGAVLDPLLSRLATLCVPTCLGAARCAGSASS